MIRSFLAVPLLAVTLPAQPPPATAAIDKAITAYASVRTARASFEQLIDNPLTGTKLTSRGEFEQARPDKFAFRFEDPKGDVILSDGRFVWVYLPSSTPGQVIRAPLSADISGSIDLIGTFFTDPKRRYTISDAGAATIGGRATRAVTLVPKGTDARFVRAKVWIDQQDGTLRQFEAEEHSGMIRQVRITSFDANATVSPSAFSFRIPKGVRVVDQSEMR